MRRSALQMVLALVVLSLLFTAGRSAGGASGARWPSLSEPPPRQGGGSKDAAVVVGIGDYDELPDVAGASANGRAWEDWFRRSRRLRPSHVAALYDRQAKKELIEEAVASAARAVEPGGTLWFVFIGHGVPSRERDEGMLATYDAGRQERLLYARSIRQSALLAALARGRQARTVVVLDACFSGQATGSDEPLAPGLQPVIPTALVASPSVVLLTAGKPNQLAGPLPGVKRPAFSYLLLGALRGWADQSEWTGDRDGRVTAGEAMSYVQEALAALRVLTGRSQDPQGLFGEGAGGPGLVLAERAREAGPDLVALASASPSPGAAPLELTEPARVERLGTIRPEVGMLRVEGSPPGARVTIEGPRDFGTRGRLATTLPYGPADVPAGTYEVTVSAPGHDEEKRSVVIYADRTEVARVELVRSEGVLEIVGEPEGAKVELSCSRGFAKVFGLPGTLTVPRGSCTVVVSRGGYERFERRVDVPGGRRSRVEVKLTQLRRTTGRLRTTRPTRGTGASAGRAGIEWVRIPAGSFQMGSPASEEGRYSDEGPVHRVRVRGFELAKTEVTVRQYRACVTSGACTAPGTGEFCNWGRSGRDDHPVNCVDWEQARAFARWIGGRLPSEAEWEYAARAGTTGARYGSLDAVAWHHGNSSGTTHAVGEKRANAWGLYDMLGNVWEWVEDCWHGDYDGAPSDGSAWTTRCSGSFRVFRGGSWDYPAGLVRAAYRSRFSPGYRDDCLGFRPARSIP